MISGFSKILFNIFIFSLLSVLSVSSFLLWKEYKGMEKLRDESIIATTKELSKNLSLPVKVFDLVSISSLIKNSNLSVTTTNIRVSNLNGEILYSSGAKNAVGCKTSQDIILPILYNGTKAGTLQACVNSRNYNIGGVLSVLSFIWLLFIFIVYYFWKKSTKEVGKLNRVEAFIKNINKSEHLSERKFVEADSDVAEVYKSIYALLDDIEEKNKLLEKSKIHKAVSEKARSIAHDIKSPVGFIRNVLKYDTSVNEKTSDRILRSADIIEKVTDGLLDDYKIDGLSEGYVISNLSLAEFWDRIKFEYENTDIVFKSNIEWDEINYMEDPLGLLRSISNLVNNSVEALGQENGLVTLVSSYANGDVLIRVSDTGTGIDKSIISKIGESEITTKLGGNGIGLLNVKKYMDKINGKLSLSAESNKTLVSLNFPIS